MAATEEAFNQAKQDWNLEKLYQDLARVKQHSGKRNKLTPVEMACLRGLLCGYGPNEIAAKLNREPRGLRVDLSRGLYRYVEILTERPLNALKDWRDVADWLSKANYKTRLTNLSTQVTDSLIKIVDISLGGSNHSPVIDIKVRNIGGQVAFLKKTNFQFYKVWLLKSWVFLDEIEASTLPCAAPREFLSRSRQVDPSFDYQISFPNLVAGYTAEFLQQIPIENLDDCPYIEEFNISQCVGCNDVDRFTFTLSFPKEELESPAIIYKSNIYYLKLEIVYDEDDKVIQSQDLLLWAEPNLLPSTERYFFEKDCLQHRQIKELTSEFKEYSQHNQEVLAEVAQIDGVKSVFLNQLIQRQQLLVASEHQKQANPSLLHRLIRRVSK